MIRTAVSRDLREKMYGKVLNLPLSYYSNERKGDIISRMTNDLMEIEFSVIGTIEAVFKSPIMIIVYFISLYHVTILLCTLIKFPNDSHV